MMEIRIMVYAVFVVSSSLTAETSTERVDPKVSDQVFQADPNGYIIFCPCMGRFGNQAEHYLGGIEFAKEINRTLILPPWRTYLNVEFDEWFKPERIAEYHRVILAKDFMAHLAPTVWPPEKRIGFCYQIGEEPCKLKIGNPFTNFWDELNVDFSEIVGYHIPYHRSEMWPTTYPGDKYPVIAMRGAPASFPMNPSHSHIQKYFVYSDKIRKEAEDILIDHFGDVDSNYLAVHLRNGGDWVNTCTHVKDGNIGNKLMASYQCQGWNYDKKLTMDMCYPSKEHVIEYVGQVLKFYGLKRLLVATDKDNMVQEFQTAFPDVKVVNPNPWLPVVDTYLLSHSKHFIGNCVSSFSSFVWRHRSSHNLGASSHFGDNQFGADVSKNDEL